MKKALFIYNPNAGKELLKPKLSDVLDIIVKAGYEVVVYPTQSYRDAYKKVSRFTDHYDLVICSGGDGTLDEVVTGMMKREERIPIGYIPTGTTNDFANSLHIPKDLLQAANTAVNGEPFACDVGRFNDDIFVYIAAFGLFTDVSYQTKQEVKNILGHLAYVLEGMTRLFDIPSYQIRVTHDDQIIEDEFIFGMVTNSRSVGGFRNMIGKNVVFDDGEFEVTLIKTPKNPIALQEIVGALLISQINSKYMYSFKTGSIRFESLEEIPWTLDGEFGGQHDTVEIHNCQKTLEIMVPEGCSQELSEMGKKHLLESGEMKESGKREGDGLEMFGLMNPKM
ncbi:YegS/Rv2252/BmrU family lipid kinase [Bariatricus massiliensis]|uniref:YegS/Rv2252/BmrU family lipid kinase n=1 Tax=Bariatricus massiliensis TaxID=1745713 RepID=A0ABS8DGR0_9FIRM|nr:YegS/Rv2252/BmrU family lipid kinase [Bariatricus massiliensis]MCB7304494.1 YegS/Rv2252/BmrU family lipid kinase [Bariatricus massiliensis]MCB7375146.1 YegS/Rv2252/BmrU family lipid kinase [Bariatricus massiliensis]MCB7387605.1 YegS/Rv2252/BmrU family lipid kinase [Bariatricus massiliensis]MCB7411766.1 YegS/Rv2252/BmrU family lipid kinase [Bariatricus massiliensis]MCQ5253902.1 YegS/Rv2252/BmrU family lipid kinase [Bariatricus massiliensis]